MYLFFTGQDKLAFQINNADFGFIIDYILDNFFLIFPEKCLAVSSPTKLLSRNCISFSKTALKTANRVNALKIAVLWF